MADDRFPAVVDKPTHITSEADFDAHMERLQARENDLDQMAIVADPHQVINPGNVNTLKTTVQWMDSGPAPVGTERVDDYIERIKKKTIPDRIDVDWYKWGSWWERLWSNPLRFFRELFRREK